MIKLDGAIINEQGVTFAIVVVKKWVVDSLAESNKSIAAYSHYFPRMPIVLMSFDASRRPVYRGRPDIVKFLAKVPLSQIPLKQYTFR